MEGEKQGLGINRQKRFIKRLPNSAAAAVRSVLGKSDTKNTVAVSTSNKDRHSETQGVHSRQATVDL